MTMKTVEDLTNTIMDAYGDENHPDIWRKYVLDVTLVYGTHPMGAAHKTEVSPEFENKWLNQFGIKITDNASNVNKDIPEAPAVNESHMNDNKKQFIYHITENNFSEANKSLEKLFESKLQTLISAEINRIDEGFFDRLSARASGLGAGLKARLQNVGTRTTSAAKAIGQNIAGAATGQGFSAGQATVDKANKAIAANDPRKRSKAAKADNIINSFEKDLSTLYPDLDVSKLLGNLRKQINFSKA